MRPSLPLIALGLGTAIALSAIDPAFAQRPSQGLSLTDKDDATKTSRGAVSAPVSADSEQSPVARPETTQVAQTSPPPPTPEVTAPLVPESAPAPAPTNAPSGSPPNPGANNTTPSAPVVAPETNPPTAPAPTAPAPTPTGEGDRRSQETAPAPNPAATPPTQARTAPEYLDPDPNPLLLPTRPEEVEIVGTQPLTLQQVLELAQRNSRELQQAQLELEQRRAQLQEAQADRLPTLQVGAGLSASENQNRNQTVQTPAGPIVQEDPDADDTNVTLNSTVQLNYDVFTGGRRSATIAAAEGRVRFQELQVESVAEQLRLDVIDEYYDIQQRDEEVRIARSTVEENERSLRDAQAQERAGVGTRFDVLQAQVDLANAQQDLTQALSQQRIARRQLVQRLGLSEQVDIAAADTVTAAGRWNLSLEDSIVLAYRNRAELEQQLVQRDISEEQRRAALANLLPQVSAFAQYDVAKLLNGDDDNNDFEDDYSFGVRVNLNLFDGGQARARARQEEINSQLAESQFAQVRNQVRFQVEQAYRNLQASFANIGTTDLAVTQAQEALRLARLRFQAGVGTQSDVLRSQTALTRAEVDRLRAILGYNRALVQLQRFVSNLPEGNLYETP